MKLFKNKLLIQLFLALASPFLLWFGWPPNHLNFIVFFGFVPLLFLQDFIQKNISKKRTRTLFLFSYLTFICWNIFCTYWIYQASVGGAILAITANSFIMCLPVLLFQITRIRTSDYKGYLSLVVYWTVFEHLHMRWDLSWPWLSLGNSLAMNTTWIQWYEYTGVSGGTIWILIINILIYHIIKEFIKINFHINEKIIKRIVLLIAIFFIPFLISLKIYYSYNEKNNPMEITIVQPNIDPYNEKFEENGNSMYLNKNKQLQRFFELSKNALLSLSPPLPLSPSSPLSSSPHLLLWPETALPEQIFINRFFQSSSFKMIDSLLINFPNTKLISGLNLYQIYKTEKERTATATKFSDGQYWYDAYNSALFIDNTKKFQYYHKSKLVPGVELMPYPALFRFLEPLAIKLGGSTGSLGRQKECTVFQFNDTIAFAPIICYESIYGEYVTEYVKKGARFLAIITNDGWWGNTPGYRQHLYYGTLRAIETRRSIARCANTGISCFINQRGDILKETEWWKMTAINGKINLNDTITFYTRYGDYLGKIAIILCIYLLISWYRRS